MAELEREIESLIRQVKAGAKGFARSILNDSLESLGAEQDRLAREFRKAPAPQPQLTPEALTSRFHDLLTDLGETLNGDERDVARARDILRKLITRVTITPYGEPDRRGAGPVRVTIEGEVSRLVDHAMLDRKIMYDRGTKDSQDLSIATFKLYIDLDRTLSSQQEGIWPDMAAVGRLLDGVEWPVILDEVVECLSNRVGDARLDATVNQRRASNALRRLVKEGWVHALELADGAEAWVWTDPLITDDAWRERRLRRAEMLPRVRMSAPDAFVVIVGRSGQATNGD